MDVADFIKREGKTEAPNPLYNAKSKKNKQPRSIIVDDLDYKPTGAVNMAIQDANKQVSVDAKDIEVYRKNGLNWNSWENLDKELSDRQSNWTKAGNALAQTLVSELALGTIKGISDLFDLIGQATGISDKDYSNPVSSKLEEWQEQFREYAPIYSDPNKHISNGGLTDFGWWASNIPSVISSLTLLIPSTGITKGLSYLGKLGKVGKGTRKATRFLTGASSRLKKGQQLNKFQRFANSASTRATANTLLENASTAVLSRAMENYQEARGTYNDMYAEALDYLSDDNKHAAFVEQNREMLQREGIDENDREAIAKHIAGKSADQTFQLDWLNVGFDVMQMYALGSAWKGMKNADHTAAVVKRAERDYRRFAGKSKEEISKLLSERKFTEKAKDWIGDRLYASKLIVGSELSEGVEEAINHIATQEGMHYGRAMLGTEERTGNEDNFWRNVVSGFDGRLKEYAQDPALYDAAFWGVMGGVIFQAAGSKFKQISNKITNGKSKANEESKQENLPWYALDLLPENKRRVSEIENRVIAFQDYKDKLARINAGEDVENSEGENKAHFDTNSAGELTESGRIQQQAAREKLQDEFIQSLTLRAMNVGNYDMLKAYMQDENVRKMFAESGIFGTEEQGKTKQEIQAEANAFSQRAVAQMEKVEKLYDENLIAVDAATASYKGEVPIEYLQIIATNNTNTQLTINNTSQELDNIDTQIAALEAQFADKLDQSVNHRGNARVNTITDGLGRLRAERKAIVSKKEKTLSDVIALDKIDRDIESLERDLVGSELIYATYWSLRYAKDGNGYTQSNTEESLEYWDNMILKHDGENAGKLFEEDFGMSKALQNAKINSRARTRLSDAELGEFNAFAHDARNTNTNLRNISPDLADLYTMHAALSVKLARTKNDIRLTPDEVTTKLSELHNTMNEARTTAINQSRQTIRDLYKKYGWKVQDYIAENYYGLKPGQDGGDISQLTEAEQKSLNDALKVLALTEATNRNIYEILADDFDTIDLINFANEQNNVNDESEENPTNLDEISATENSEPITSSVEQSESNTEQPMGENEPIVDNPNDISNRQPSVYFNFHGDKKNGLTSHKHSATDNGQSIIAYDNGDGTFTIDVRNPKAKLDNRLFENANGVDHLGPVKIVQYPMVKKDKRGKFVIAKKGVLINDTPGNQSEIQDENASQPQQEGKPEAQPQTQPQVPQSTPTSSPSPATVSQEESANNSNPAPANLSTGEVATPSNTSQEIPLPVPAPIKTPSTMEHGEVIIDIVPDGFNIGNAALSEMQKAFRENKDITDAELDALAQKIINDNLQNGTSRDIVESTVNKQLALIKRVIAKKRANVANTMQSAVDEIIVSQSSLIDINPSNDVVEQYKNSVRTMLNQYVKEVGIEKLNDKYYINLEDLLRYINQITNDTSTATVIFNNLKEHLKLDEFTKDYAIMDEEDADKGNFIENVLKSAEERYLEKISDSSVQRVDIRRLLEDMDEEEIDKFYEALDALNKGDELDFKVVGGAILVMDKQGRLVGKMSLPRIDSRTGAYNQINDGWQYAIDVSNNGTISDPLKNLFSRWIKPASNDKYSQEINAIIHELAYTKPSEARKKELLEKFYANPEIKRATSNGFIKERFPGQAINGLVKLWRFKNTIESSPTLATSINNLSAINEWFKKLLNSYDAVTAISRNPSNFSLSVAEITDGEIIRIVENNAQEAQAQALPAKEAIAGGVNPDVHKIAIGTKLGTITISGNPNEAFGGLSTSGKQVSAGNTFVCIPNRSGRYAYVQAFPAKVFEDYIGSDAKEINEAIKQHAIKLFKEHKEHPSHNTHKAIYDFFNGVINSKNGLFTGAYFNDLPNGGGFNINFKDGLRITIYEKNAQGFSTSIVVNHPNFPNRITKDNKGNDVNRGNSKLFAFDSKEAEQYLGEFINNLSYQINFAYIASDNAANMTLQGIASKENGKFIIRVGDKEWVYNSYNDFMLSNNLLRLNTKPNEKGNSNYNRTGSRTQAANQIFEVKINSNTTSPVGNNQPTQTAQSANQQPTAISVNDKVANILNSDSKNKGVDIVKAIVGTSSLFTNDTLKAFETLGILPKNIIFDADFNNRPNKSHINAEINVETGVVTVGQKWIDMFNDPLSRPQAIRKLIHEQLHYLLHKKEYRGAVRSIKNIFEEFKQANDKDGLAQDDHIRDYEFRSLSEDRALEEFLVETLTSAELAKRLNEIDADVVKKGGNKNLFQKILEHLAKIFGWNVRKGSLYEKELNTIRTTFKEAAKQTKEIKVDNNTETQTEQQAQQPAISEPKTEETPQPKIEVKEDDSKSGRFDEDYSDDEDIEFDSSVTEVNEITQTDDNKTQFSAPTIQSLQDRLPIEQQPKFASLVARGEFSISCK